MREIINKPQKDSKGFSLVELIVVVLIIAIIAVALAPQVMKYINKSMINIDLNNQATITRSVQVAYTDYLENGGEKIEGDGNLKTSSVNVEDVIPACGEFWDLAEADGKSLAAYINETVGDWPDIKSTNSHTWNITIKNNSVTVSYDA